MRSYTRSTDYGELTFDVIDDGPSDPSAETIVLLHGFPQDATSWDAVRPKLTEAGYRVLAPHQRGYSPGARPPQRRAYRKVELVGDIVALLDAVGVERAHVVGHDWGGAIAWLLAVGVPDRLASLTAVSTPHPRAFLLSALRGQLLKSWYMGVFQLPMAPERFLLGNDLRFGVEALARSGLPAARARTYLERLRERGALSAALNWYRSLPLEMGAMRHTPAVEQVPTLYVWSNGDVALGRAAADATERYVRGPYRFEALHGVSHWIPEEVPDQLARLILEHVAAAP